MKILFDLDYTLMDTKKFKDRLAEIFAIENFADDYEKHFKAVKDNFSSEKYLALLRNQGRLGKQREEELRSELAKLMSQLDEYLFAGVAGFLEELKNLGAEQILLTFGDKDWQAEKVRNLSINKYFNLACFEDSDKRASQCLKSLQQSSEKVLIVNDNAREAEEIAKIIGGQAKIFLVDGPYAKNIEHNRPIRKLSELTHVYE